MRTVPRCTALLTLLVVVGLSLFSTAAEARDRLFCKAGDWYQGHSIECGGHLQPQCTSGAACNTGHNAYSGSPFPITIDCPTIREPLTGLVLYDVPDVKVSTGCYNRIPTCNDCGGQDQPPCPAEAEPICGGCDEGYIENGIGLCQLPDDPGQPCGAGIGCSGGLVCDPATFRCRAAPEENEPCNIFSPCADGLQCTLAFKCSHSPARSGETCDATTPCGDGLYCAPGFPQTCKARAKPGEQCSLGVPCVSGAVCPAAPFPGESSICFPSVEITPQLCETFYSPRVARDAPDDATMTRASGRGLVDFGEGSSIAHGVAYGQNGRFGCYNASCRGVDADASIEWFFAKGTYNDFESVGGASYVGVVEGQVLSLVNVSYSTVWPDANVLGPSIGSEISVGPGLGASPSPIAAGYYECSTDLITLYGDAGSNQPPEHGTDTMGLPPPPDAPPLEFGVLQFDGVDDGLILAEPADSAQLIAGSAFTLELWIRPLQNGQTATLVVKPGEYRLALVSGELVYQMADSTGWDTVTGTRRSPLVNQWTHVALMYDAGQTQLLIDGEPVSLRTGTGSVGDAMPGNDALYVGMANGGVEPFAGQLDALRIWSRALSTGELRAGLGRDRPPATDGLTAAWRFDEADGQLLLDDGPSALNFALDALGSAAAPIRAVSDRHLLGGAVHFNGIDQHATVDDETALAGLTISSALTLEAWVFPTGTGADPTYGGVIVSKEGEYLLGRAPDGRLYYALANSSPGWVSTFTNVILPAHEWHHVALTYDAVAGQIRLLLDGVVAYSRAGSGNVGDRHPEAAQLRVGGRERNETAGAQQHFRGLVDELRIWSIARSDAAIAADMALVPDPDSPGLLGFWRFDEGNTELFFDSSAAARHGRLGLDRGWQAPVRVESAALGGYPASLISPTCRDGICELDSDGDMVSDYADNCLFQPNPNQSDGDMDRFGGRCDADFNGDGVVNFGDLAQIKANFGKTNTRIDLDGNGIINFADLAILKSRFGKAPGPSALVP